MKFGKLSRSAQGLTVLTYERFYPHPPDKVWRALTEPEHLAGWFPTRIDGERRAGAELRFAFEGEEGPALQGRMNVFEPPRRLEYTWGEDLLRFELSPEGDGTRVVLVTELGDRARAPRDGAGWHGCLENLGRVLGGGEASPWPDLYRKYLAELGLGAFPAFLAGENVRGVWHTPGLDGHAFGGGPRVLLLQANQDAEMARHAAPEAYVLVVEGSFELTMGGQTLPLGPGQELTLPEGIPIAGKIRAGTRLVLAEKA